MASARAAAVSCRGGAASACTCTTSPSSPALVLAGQDCAGMLQPLWVPSTAGEGLGRLVVTVWASGECVARRTSFNSSKEGSAMRNR